MNKCELVGIGNTFQFRWVSWPFLSTLNLAES